MEAVAEPGSYSLYSLSQWVYLFVFLRESGKKRMQGIRAVWQATWQVEKAKDVEVY